VRSYPALGRVGVRANVEAVDSVDGPAMRLPGSDQFVLVVGVWLVVVAAVVLLVGAVLRWRRRRKDPSQGWWSPALIIGAVLVVVAVPMIVANRPISFRTPEFPPLPALVPPESFFNSRVDALPVAAESERWVNSQRDGAGALGLVPGIESRPTLGVVFGVPFNVVRPDTPRYDVAIALWPASSSPGPYPITDPAYIESMPAYGIDNHYVGYEPETNTSWELLALRRWFGRWEADSGAVWDLDDLSYSSGKTIAAGLPLLPGTITYDEVASDSLDHVVLGATPISRREAWVWPARSTDGVSTDPDAPPMGAWMRLRSDVDTSALGPQAKVIAAAMQRHGVVISDTSGFFTLRGTPDARWDDADIDTLRTLSVEDFEFVDVSTLFVADDTMEARQSP